LTGETGKLSTKDAGVVAIKASFKNAILCQGHWAEVITPAMLYRYAMSAFVTADLHLDHAKILDFIAPDGSRFLPPR
jgi:hypothetical protein